MKLRAGLTMGPDSLLQCVEKYRQESDFKAKFEALVKRIERLESLLQTTAVAGKEIPHVDLRPLFHAQRDMIHAFQAGRNSTELAEAMTSQIREVDKAWSYKTTSLSEVIDQEVAANLHESLGLGSKRSPSFLPLGNVAANCQRLAEFLAGQAKHFGWSHPGVLMAAETLAILCGSRREADLTVRSKILFAAPQRGVLANITLERIADGCGLLIPDPMRCSYLCMDNQFSTGLQNALWAARNYAKQHFGSHVHRCDWRWSIDLLSATSRWSQQERQIQVPMGGPSAEVVFACAMIASHQDNPDNVGNIDPLDPHVGATASIGHPGAENEDELRSVGAIEDKTLVNEMETKRLVEVVIAKGQKESSLPPDKRYEFCCASSLAEAYEFMTRHPRITRGLNRYFHRWAGEHLGNQCTPWIMPEIKEFAEKEGRVAEDVDLRSAPVEDLVEDVDLLLSGRMEMGDRRQRDSLTTEEQRERWIGNRVRIFADSGLGKSMLMLFCQSKIAGLDSCTLPLRIGRTTGEDASLSIRWNEGDVVQKLAKLPSVSKAFDAYYQEAPQANSFSLEDRVAWFRWMLRKGRVVFLIDALDQIVTAVDGLGQFLASADIRHCPVMVTGRPEACLNRQDAFVENDWRTLRVEPFDRPRQEQYLGAELAEQLLLENEDDEIDYRSSEDDLRKHQWKDLVNTPLLLSLIKMLATEGKNGVELEKIHNRFELYDHAVNELIQKGWQTTTPEQRLRLRDGAEIKTLLGQLSWFMLRAHDFTGILEGDRYKVFEASLGDKADLLQELKQIDVTTAFQVLDRADAGGLAFRHRSFVEFFAACHLMATKPDESQVDLDSGEALLVSRVPAAVRAMVLDEIHSAQSVATGDGLELKRLGDWQDTLRFALGHPNVERRSQLAKDLIEHGNPWIVYQALKRDQVELPKLLDSLARWLVHRDYPDWFDYSKAIAEVTDLSKTRTQSEAQLALVEYGIDPTRMTAWPIRDAAYLSPLREIAEGHRLHIGVSTESSLNEQMQCLPAESGTWDFTGSFYPVAGGHFSIDKYHKELGLSSVKIEPFELADFPVSNALFELFCPSHRRERGEFSVDADGPVNHVNWYMAIEFCHWLSALTGRRYRLATEWEWEWACRWHDTLEDVYWWGAEMDGKLCWFSGTSNGSGTRRRSAALQVFRSSQHAHPSWRSETAPGLLDLSGNVWEWCANSYGLEENPTPESSRVLRGGSWVDVADVCRSSFRGFSSPVNRHGSNGFRVCRV